MCSFGRNLLISIELLDLNWTAPFSSNYEHHYIGDFSTNAISVNVGFIVRSILPNLHCFPSCLMRSSNSVLDLQFGARYYAEERGGHDEPGERGRGRGGDDGGGGGRDGRGRGGGAGGGVGGDGGEHPAHPCRHRQLHPPGESLLIPSLHFLSLASGEEAAGVLISCLYGWHPYVQVSEMLDAGRALFKDLAADFEERLCT